MPRYPMLTHRTLITRQHLLNTPSTKMNMTAREHKILPRILRAYRTRHHLILLLILLIELYLQLGKLDRKIFLEFLEHLVDLGLGVVHERGEDVGASEVAVGGGGDAVLGGALEACLRAEVGLGEFARD